jgi:hypothetical protein
MDLTKLVLHNFEVLIAYYKYIGRNDLEQIHRDALEKLRAHNGAITPAHPVLSVSVFDGVNTRNKVLTILQSKADLEEVAKIKASSIYTELNVSQFRDF